MHKTLEDIARELGGTVGRTKWEYAPETKHRKPKRDNKARTKAMKQLRELRNSTK